MRNLRIEIDKMAKKFRTAISHPGDGHTAKAVPDQDDVAQFLGLDQRHHVLNVDLQVNSRTPQM